MSNYINYKVWDEISKILMVPTVRLGNEKVISSHILMGMWLFVHAWIKVNPQKGPQAIS